MARSCGYFVRAGLVMGLLCQGIGIAHALPSLQLGPGAIGDWTYDDATQTWVTSSNPFSMDAFANTTGVDGGNGSYAWDPAGSVTQHAYLIFATLPDIGAVDGFDLSVVGDDGALPLITSGYGAPPLNDPNSIASHGIFDTYFEIYEFQFNDSLTMIGDTEPGRNGVGNGFAETFDITINSLLDGVTGLHMDLFTVSGDGIYDPDAPLDSSLVNAFASFAHDADFVDDAVAPVPAPPGLALAVAGLVAVSIRGRPARK